MGKTAKISFKTVGIICKKSIWKDVSRLTSVMKKMEKLGAKLLIDEFGSMALKSKTSSTNEEICKKSTLIISLGGDGTLLRTARLLKPTHSPPVLGINIGRLGFLTESTLSDLDHKLALIRSGKFRIDARSMLAITLKKCATSGLTSSNPKFIPTKNPIPTHLLALNDVVINQGGFARLIKMSIRIDDLQAASFKADGLIIASPTGSTGHSLSAGGPILHPKVGGIVLNPICPVLLSMRPIILPDTRTIYVKIETAHRSKSGGVDPVPEPRESLFTMGLTIDGQETYDLGYEDEIEVTRAPQTLNLIHTEGRNYYKTLNDKLSWGQES